MAAGGFNKTKAKKLLKNLDAELKNCDMALKQLYADLDELQRGTGEISYWSGSRAYEWIESALLQYDHNVNLIAHNKKCTSYLETLVKGGSSL